MIWGALRGFFSPFLPTGFQLRISLEWPQRLTSFGVHLPTCVHQTSWEMCCTDGLVDNIPPQILKHYVKHWEGIVESLEEKMWQASWRKSFKAIQVCKSIEYKWWKFRRVSSLYFVGYIMALVMWPPTTDRLVVVLQPWKQNVSTKLSTLYLTVSVWEVQELAYFL